VHQGRYGRYEPGLDVGDVLTYARQSSGGGAAPGTPPYNPPWYALTDIYWDPAGTQGGSDKNTGATIGSPLLTWAEIVRRYGSTRPEMNPGQSVTIHLLTSQPAGQDPAFLKMLMSQGQALAIVGTLTASGAAFTGTVVAKNRATGQRLTLSGSASLVAGAYVFNSTRGSYAFVTSVAGGVATMTQPLPSSLVTTIHNPTASLAIDDTWTTGDTYQVFTLPTVNLKQFEVEGWDVTNGGGNLPNLAWMQWLNIVDFSGSGRSTFPMHNMAFASGCTFGARVGMVQDFSTSGASAPMLLGCNVGGIVESYGGDVPYLFGGVLRNNLAIVGGGCALDGDVQTLAAVNATSGCIFMGAAYFAGALTADFAGIEVLKLTASIGAFLWGPGSVQMNNGANMLNASATLYAAFMLLTGGMKLGTSTVGMTILGGTITAGTLITPANIDANGGMFLLPNNCSYS